MPLTEGKNSSPTALNIFPTFGNFPLVIPSLTTDKIVRVSKAVNSTQYVLQWISSKVQMNAECIIIEIHKFVYPKIYSKWDI